VGSHQKSLVRKLPTATSVTWVLNNRSLTQYRPDNTGRLEKRHNPESRTICNDPYKRSGKVF
jgi:hypothetical protein